MDNIYKRLSALDLKKSNTDTKGMLDGLAYGISQNESLGVPKSSNFLVNIPFSEWKPMTGAIRSSLAAGFVDVLAGGVNAVKAPDVRLQNSIDANSKQVFIDITQLHVGDWKQFFLRCKGFDGDANMNLAQKIGLLIDQIPAGLSPVVRYLVGYEKDIAWDAIRQDFEELFWPAGQCVLKSQTNAKLCVGLYCPTFEPLKAQDVIKAPTTEKEIDSLVAFIRRMINDILLSAFVPSDAKKQLNEALTHLSKEEVLKSLTKDITSSISWNHAKMIAVHGTTLMTGGGNYWPSYADNERGISDLCCKVKGDAAVDAHAYCNCLWDYLNDEHKTDSRSFAWTTPMGKNIKPDWKRTTKNIPMYLAPAIKNAGKLRTLTVAKLGDWVGSMRTLRYPVQAIDAVRDIVNNLIFRKAYLSVIADAGDPTPEMRFAMGIPNFLIGDSTLENEFKAAGISPAAWASRMARVFAIEEAGKGETVYIDAAAIASFLHSDNKAWFDPVAKTGYLVDINAKAGMKGNDQWDGVIWPYDLIQAIATALHEKQVVFNILLSASDKFVGGKDYADKVAASELYQRVRWYLGLLAGPKTAELLKERLVIRRISSGDLWNHNKVYCIGKKLLYIGSDNPYANYNEEHGILVEDPAAINDWFVNNWTPRWKASIEADMTPNALGQVPTMLDKSRFLFDGS